jgi:hypothetical protein
LEFKSILEKKRNCYRNCFNTEAGKLVLKDLFKVSKMNRSSYSNDTHLMAKEEGRKEVYRYIINTLNMDLEAILTEEER